MAESQFTTDFSVWGPRLDIGGLLRRAPLRVPHSVWRRGEVFEEGPARSSGVSVAVFRGGSRKSLHRALARFLQREAPFLEEVRRAVKGKVHAGFMTTIFVEQYRLSIGVELPAALLAAIGRAGLAWAVLGVPCSEDGAVQVSRD
jgi:hypothetical protein